MKREVSSAQGEGRETERVERRDIDRERGEPVAQRERRLNPPRATPHAAKPLSEWKTRPRILVTNDDGIESRGLLALKQSLEPLGDVYVLAPETNQSAVGHTKTFMRPLRVRERTLADGTMGYSVDGSPTDAVSLALLGYFDIGFDLIASGINYGANLGDDITYSGTVSAAMEAVLNVPAFAISQEYYEHPDFTLASQVAYMAAVNILENGLGPGELININVPAIRAEDARGRGDPDGQARLPGRADRAARSARHSLLLDRRPATVRAGRTGHRFPRGGQQEDRDHAHPAGSDGAKDAQPPERLEMEPAQGRDRCAGSRRTHNQGRGARRRDSDRAGRAGGRAPLTMAGASRALSGLDRRNRLFIVAACRSRRAAVSRGNGQSGRRA